MTFYEKSEIRRGLFMTKDASDPVFIEKSGPVRYGETLSDIQRRLESVRKKFAIVRQVVGQRR